MVDVGIYAIPTGTYAASPISSPAPHTAKHCRQHRASPSMTTSTLAIDVAIATPRSAAPVACTRTAGPGRGEVHRSGR